MLKKLRMNFLLTIGSHWPEKDDNNWKPVVPIGGYQQYVDVEFEYDEDYDWWIPAMDAIEQLIGRRDFHVWYWSFLKDG